MKIVKKEITQIYDIKEWTTYSSPLKLLGELSQRCWMGRGKISLSVYGKSRALTEDLEDSLFLLLRLTTPAEIRYRKAKSFEMSTRELLSGP